MIMGDGPLLRIVFESADLHRDGFRSTGLRRIEMSPQQMIDLAALLSAEEMQVIGIFLRDMRLHSDENGDRYYVEGFSREYLISEGIAPYRARKGLTGLREKGILADEWAPTAVGVGATAQGWKCLNGAFVSLDTTEGQPRRYQPVKEARDVLRDAVARHESVPDAASGRIPATRSAEENEQVTASGRNPATRPATVDNSSGRISTGRSPAVDNSSGRVPATRSATPANSQVRAFGRFSTGRDAADSSNPEIREFRVSTGPGKEPRTAAVAAFARSSTVLSVVAARPDRLSKPLTRSVTGPLSTPHAVALLDFFAVEDSGSPVATAVDLALHFLTRSGEEAAEVASELRDHYRRMGVNLKPMDEDNVLTATALAILSGLDSKTPLTTVPGWFGHGLKPTTNWRPGPVLSALFATLLAVATAPKDGHEEYDVADVSDPRFVDYLREATAFVVERGLLPQFDGPFEDLVLFKDPLVHAKIIRTYEQSSARTAAS